MKTKLLFLTLIINSMISFAQTTTTDVVPKGVYSEIDVLKQNEMINRLSEPSTRSAAVDTVFSHVNQYNPPVLYMFSLALFSGGEQQNAIDWYLFAQLNAMYDANRCTDNTAKEAVTIMESQVRPLLDDFIQNNKNNYLLSVDRAVGLFKKVQQDYDIRWINLHGMNAMLASLGENDNSKNDLTVPQTEWGKIKEETIKKFVQNNK